MYDRILRKEITLIMARFNKKKAKTVDEIILKYEDDLGNLLKRMRKKYKCHQEWYWKKPSAKFLATKKSNA